MTRVLSELLNAVQPRFATTIQSLERAAGRPSVDVSLTSEIRQRAQQKLRILGLDPIDSTAEEVFHALRLRLQRDETVVRQSLSISADAAPKDILSAVSQHIGDLSHDQKTFALKLSVAKRLLKKQPPKKAMKQLHYRSVDSMLKHESVAHVYVASFLCESLSWRKKFLDSYTTLRSTDFETRNATISMPTTARWEKLVEDATKHHKQTTVVVKELGAVVVLPIRQDLPGLALISFIQLASALNAIASTGSYLKLQHVKPGFGEIVRRTVVSEPLTSAELVGRPVPWVVIHQYYARFKKAYNSIIFEPHIQPSDLQWIHPEAMLRSLHDALSFWEDTRYTGYLHSDSIVSLNVIDVALAYVNTIGFTERMVEGMREHLWYELMVRYLNHENVEHAIVADLGLQPEFARID